MVRLVGLGSLSVWLALVLSAAPLYAQWEQPTERWEEIPAELRLSHDNLDAQLASPGEPAAVLHAPGTILPIEPPAPVESSGSWLRCGQWYFGSDVVLLNRDINDDVVLATDLSSGGQLSVGRREPDLAASLRMTLGRMLFRDARNADHSLEFTYFGLGNWSTAGRLDAVSNNFIVSNINGDIGGFNFADTQSFVYDADLSSFELNYRISHRSGRDQLVLKPDGHWKQRLQPGRLLSMMVGVRVVELDEAFRYTSASTIPQLRRGDLNIQTSNSLVGFQLGGDYVHQFQYWNVGARGNAGAYVNFASRETALLAVDPVQLNANYSDRVTDEAFSFVGQLALFASYQIRPNFSIRAGYELMWINAVALAPEQVQFTPVPSSDITIGSAQFYQGFSIGGELVW